MVVPAAAPPMKGMLMCRPPTTFSTVKDWMARMAVCMKEKQSGRGEGGKNTNTKRERKKTNINKQD